MYFKKKKSYSFQFYWLEEIDQIYEIYEKQDQK